MLPTQGSKPGLPNYGWILYQLSYKGNPRILEWVAYPFSRRSSWPRNWTGVSCIAGGFFTTKLCGFFTTKLSGNCGSAGKESACNAGALGPIPGLGRFPGEGNGYPFQYSGLENSMDCIVHGVAKSRTWLSEGFPGGSDGKESSCSVGDLGLIPGLGRFPGEGKGYPLQYSGLENSMDRGAW